jgi:hypothetical protein
VLLAFCAFAAFAAKTRGAMFSDDFSRPPEANGWEYFGDAALFRWDSAEESVAVTWDSSRVNSYLWRPLPMTLTRRDSFAFSFELRLDEVEVGVNPERPYTFEIAVGLLNRADAASPEFRRGTGRESPNLVELDYFADSGFGATISPTILSRERQLISSFNFPLELTPGAWFQATLTFDPDNQALSTTMTRAGERFGPIKDVKLGAAFTEFHVDAFAIMSYSDAGADGSIRARGRVDNVSVTTPGVPIERVEIVRAGGNWSIRFRGEAGWSYALEISADLRSWIAEPPVAAEASGEMELIAPGSLDGGRFFRVRAVRV